MPHKDPAVYKEYHRLYRIRRKKEISQKTREWKLAYRETRYWSEIKQRYGINKDHYLALVEKQGNRCGNPACDNVEPIATSNKVWCVDHDHETGDVRGLLCRQCNSGLGMLDDSPKKILGLHAYICGHMNKNPESSHITQSQ